MWWYVKPIVQGLIASVLIVLLLLLLGVSFVMIPNAFFVLAAIVLFGLVIVGHELTREMRLCKTCEPACEPCWKWALYLARRVTLIIALALIAWAVGLSFLVMGGTLIIGLPLLWLGLFLKLALLAIILKD